MNAVQASWLLVGVITLSLVWSAACPFEHHRGRHTIKHSGVADEMRKVIGEMNRHVREQGDGESGGGSVAGRGRSGRGGRHRVAGVPDRT